MTQVKKVNTTWTLDDLQTIAENVDALQANLEQLRKENDELRRQVESHTVDIRTLNPSRAAFPVSVLKDVSPGDILHSVFVGGTIALASNPMLMQNPKHRQDHFRRMLEYGNEIVSIMADRFGVASTAAEADSTGEDQPKTAKRK